MIKKLAGLVIYFFLIFFLAINSRFIALQAGLIKDRISISGTGSMYPTFPKGLGDNPLNLANQSVAQVWMRRFPAGLKFFGRDFFDYQLQHSDIVSFSNSQTDIITMQESGRTSGFIKRVIALPGDRVEIRDGFVRLNGQELAEPYTAVARSTFGGSYLPDCRVLQVPEGSVFVLGDNRKSSSDSRYDLGLVAISDIDHVLPYTAQNNYAGKWRDASKDYLQANHPTLDTGEYLNLLNEKRTMNGLKSLMYQPKLQASAKIRADIIIKFDDFSFSATRSGYTMEKAMRDVGYTNIIWGEAPTMGYYDARELIDNFFHFPETKKFLLQGDFQETGITAEVGNINGCPVQVIVQHFAGYKPPNYSQEMIKSWQKGLDDLNKVYQGWLDIKNYPDIYSSHQAEYNNIIGLFRTRISRVQAIVNRLRANQWLTPEEEQWMKEDESLGKQLQDLTSKLYNF